jgi:peptidoglycan/xylan/chitin deacetylase (PgdA/CDA1 family)
VYLPPAAVVADQIRRATGAIHKATGKVPALFRAPYGAWSPVVLRECAQAGMSPLDWSVDPRDWSRPGVAAIVRNIMRNTRTGSIILEHDGGGDRAPAARREPAAIISGQAELRYSRYSFTPRSAFRDIPGSAAARTDSEHAGTAATLGQVRAVAQFG